MKNLDSSCLQFMQATIVDNKVHLMVRYKNSPYIYFYEDHEMNAISMICRAAQAGESVGNCWMSYKKNNKMNHYKRKHVEEFFTEFY